MFFLNCFFVMFNGFHMAGFREDGSTESPLFFFNVDTIEVSSALQFIIAF